MLGRNPKGLGEIESKLKALVEKEPLDISVKMAAALAALSSGDEARVGPMLADLESALAKNPIEPLKPGALPNSRQRAEAARLLPLWLVARSAWNVAASKDPEKKPGSALDLRAAADRLAALAIDAASRQNDIRWTLAMLREQGQNALQRGDRAAAEAAWGKMLDKVLQPEGRKPSASLPPGSLPVTPVAPAPPAPPAATKAAIRPISYQPPAPDRTRAVTRPSGATTTATAKGRPRASVPVLTIDRFEQAMQVAALAAKNGLHELSLRAVREALKGGPPVSATADPNPVRSRVVTVGPMTNEPADPITPKVVERLTELDSLWRSQNTPASIVYEVLRDVVLPGARPNEVFVYAPALRNLAQPNRPQNVGALLAQWAIRAGKADALRAAIDARKKNPQCEIPTAVLSVQLGLALGDDDATTTALQALTARARLDALRTTSDLVCHAALPALDRRGTVGPALDALDAASKGFEGTNVNINVNLNGPDLGQNLNLFLARRMLERGDTEGGRKRLNSYIEAAERGTVRYGGDYPLYLRKQTLANVAGEYARAGLLADTLTTLGQFADTPAYSGGDPNPGEAVSRLGRLLAAKPARERYETLRAWTLPTGARRLVRLLDFFSLNQTAPAVFDQAAPRARPTWAARRRCSSTPPERSALSTRSRPTSSRWSSRKNRSRTPASSPGSSRWPVGGNKGKRSVLSSKSAWPS